MKITKPCSSPEHSILRKIQPNPSRLAIVAPQPKTKTKNTFTATMFRFVVHLNKMSWSFSKVHQSRTDSFPIFVWPPTHPRALDCQLHIFRIIWRGAVRVNEHQATGKYGAFSTLKHQRDRSFYRGFSCFKLPAQQAISEQRSNLTMLNVCRPYHLSCEGSTHANLLCLCGMYLQFPIFYFNMRPLPRYPDPCHHSYCILFVT